MIKWAGKLEGTATSKNELGQATYQHYESKLHNSKPTNNLFIDTSNWLNVKTIDQEWLCVVFTGHVTVAVRAGLFCSEPVFLTKTKAEKIAYTKSVCEMVDTVVVVGVCARSPRFVDRARPPTGNGHATRTRHTVFTSVPLDSCCIKLG